MNMPRKTLAWANKEVETFLCILGEEDVQSCRGDRHPAYHKGYCRRWKLDLGTELPPPPYWTEANRTVPHPAVETRH
ncbi:unnamed protein product [Boreogadus saida]